MTDRRPRRNVPARMGGSCSDGSGAYPVIWDGQIKPGPSSSFRYDCVVARPTVTNLHELAFTYVEAIDGFAGAGAAFDQLEGRMDTLRGRRMYGVVYPGDPVRYLACLLLDDENADDLGFERTTVPGGQYAYTLVRDWGPRISELPVIVSQLESEIEISGLAVDPDRPWLEFYRRIDELLIMLPVLPEVNQP
jgi:hypothetical protein